MYEELISRLHRYTENCVAYKLDADFADAVQQAADAIEELQKREADMTHNMAALSLKVLRAEEKQPRWIPVTERLPEYGERVLVFGGVTMYVAYYGKNRYSGESWHKLNSKSHYCNPTHWMPLPQPPKEG